MGAAVDSDVKNLAQRHAHQFALGMLFLEMQPAQHALGGTALVVLHKRFVDAGGSELVDLVGLHKIAAVVTENGRLDDLNFGDVGLDKVKFTHGFFLLYSRIIIFCIHI